jgi:Ser/Thr protein kinase RdoA (MazF antagonist)
LQRNHWSLIEQVVGDIEKRLSKYSQQASRFGLIHADLRLANPLVDSGLTRIIDDDCGFSWYLHDLASALSLHEDHVATPRSSENWLAGYSAPQNARL